MSLLRKYWPVLLVLLGFAAYFASQPHAYYGEPILPPKAAPDFTLRSASGPVSMADQRGKYVLLFFGFTNCTDVCPTTLNTVKQAYGIMGKQTDQFQTIFVSVDPARDEPAKLAQYVQAFDPSFIGLTGSKDEIDAVAANYGIYYKMDTPEADGAYEVEHTSSMLVIDPEGRIVLVLPYGLSGKQIADDLQYLLAHPISNEKR